VRKACVTEAQRLGNERAQLEREKAQVAEMIDSISN
jgi:hypothetical protein